MATTERLVTTPEADYLEVGTPDYPRYRVIRQEWDFNPGPSDSNPRGLPVRRIIEAEPAV